MTPRSITFLQDLSLNPSSFVFCRCCIIFQKSHIRYFFARESINLCPVYENTLFLTIALKPSRQSECLTVNICRNTKRLLTQNSTHLLIHISKLFNPTQSVFKQRQSRAIGKSEVGSWRSEVRSLQLEVGRPFSAFVQR